MNEDDTPTTETTWPRPYVLAVGVNVALMAYIAEFPPLKTVEDETLGRLTGMDAEAWPYYVAAMAASVVLGGLAFQFSDQVAEPRRRLARMVGSGVPFLIFLIGIVNLLSGLSGSG